MTFPEVEFIGAVEILGTFAFAVSGAIAAIRNRYDVFGVLVLAFVTAVGGGTIRDMMVGNMPVSWLTNNLAIGSASFGFLVAIAMRSQVKRFQIWILFFDAAGLGLFTVMGTQVGLEAGMNIGISVTLGTITGCFGGVIRDVLSGTRPLIFRKEIYAMASFIGGVLYVGMLAITHAVIWAQLVGIVSIIVMRMIALNRGWRLPQIKYEV